MKPKTTRRRMRRALLLIAAAAMIAATAGLAYYLSNGSATVTSTFSTAGQPADTPIKLIVNSPISGQLSPGGSGNLVVQAYNGSAVGTPNSVPVRLGKIGLNPAVGDNGISGLPAGCNRAWFTLADVTANEVIPAGDNWSAEYTLTLNFVESGTNQGACQNISPVLNLTTKP